MPKPQFILTNFKTLSNYDAAKTNFVSGPFNSRVTVEDLSISGVGWEEGAGYAETLQIHGLGIMR